MILTLKDKIRAIERVLISIMCLFCHSDFVAAARLVFRNELEPGSLLAKRPQYVNGKPHQVSSQPELISPAGNECDHVYIYFAR